MNTAIALIVGIVIGVLVQAARTARKLGCSVVPVIKSGGGPGEGGEGP